MKIYKYHAPETQVADWEFESKLLEDSERNGSGADMPIEDLPIIF